MNFYSLVVTRKAFGLLWHVRLVSSSNNEILLSSEKYYSKGNAVRAARTLGSSLNIPIVIEGNDNE